MKVLLVGCGAVGLTLASALYQSDAQTDLAARGTTAEFIAEHGIERRGLFGHAVIPSDKIRICGSVEEAGTGYDFILVSTKATANAGIAAGLAGRKSDILSPGGRIVLFQNGFGNEDAYAGAFDRSRIYHACLAIGFRRLRPNISEVTVFTSPVSIGNVSGAPADACERLADALRRGGIPCHVTDEIGKTLWAKMLYNCALNPLSAILGVRYGGLSKSESSAALIGRIIDEIFAVMHAAGYETFWKDAQAYKKEFFEKIFPPTYGHCSSTLQDMKREIPTEIDSLNGAVAALGRKFHVETPCNTIITQIIKSAESLYHDEEFTIR